jgi:Flp pilus assembly protein TadD
MVKRRIHEPTLGLLILPLLAALVAVPARAARSVDDAPEVAAIMALTPEIERFIDERVPANLPRSARVRGLMDALFGKDGLDISYGNLETKTATETFETRSGNCLSFTILFVAMARHVGLDAHFQEVGEILSWDRRGDVAVSNRHMFAEVETAEGSSRIDFLPGVEKRYRSVRRIDEARVLAHYYSNLGAEALTVEEFERAMEMFAQAIETDGTLAAAWVNMGVAQRRLGRLADAEASYLRALELNQREISAVSNLISLYQATGHHRLAAPYMKRIRKYQRSNPFFQFRQALDAAEAGNLRAARRRLKKAIRLMPEDVMFRVELGHLQMRAGRPRGAARSLRKALKLATDEAQRERIEGLLARAVAAA